MTTESQRPAGNIYDLGYRPYEGERLGRRYAILALYSYSFRAIFGLGRSGWNKVFPIGLAIIALIPAFLQLALAALVPADVEFVAPESYFAFVEIVVALFAAVVTPEIMGRDQRNRTLPLYFSRAVSRTDYVSAKIGALFVAMLIVMLTPQVMLFLGNALATEDIVNYIWDNLDQIPPILISSSLVGLTIAVISLALASQTNRRGLGTGVVIAYFIIFTTVGRILVETATGDLRNFIILMSPLDVLEGMVYWVFDATPAVDSAVDRSNLAGPAYMLATLAYAGVAIAWVYRRFLRLAV